MDQDLCDSGTRLNAAAATLTLHPLPIPAYPTKTTILPLVPVTSYPYLMRITNHPITRLPGKSIVAPRPFPVNPDMLRRRSRRPVEGRLRRYGRHEYIVRYPFPVTHHPIPFAIRPLGPMAIDKDL